MKWIWKIAAAIRNRIRLRKIEKAIGMKMYEWQKKYILSPNMEIAMPGGRANGKTVAACVRVLMYRKKPLYMIQALESYRSIRLGLEPYPTPDPDCAINVRAYGYSLQVLKELHAKCKEKGIEVFDLY